MRALGERKLLELLGAASLKAWEAEDLPLAHAASAALLSYAEHTQGRNLHPHPQPAGAARATN